MKDDEQKLQAVIKALKDVREKIKDGAASPAQIIRERQLTRRYVRLVQNGL